MSYLPIIIIIVFLVLLVKKASWAFIFFIACKMVLPPIVRVGSISLNTLMAALLLLAAVIGVALNSQSISRKQCTELIFPILYLILPLSVVGFFANLSYSFQIKNLLQFFVTEISPYIALLVLIKTKRQLNSLITVLMITYCCIALYGIYTYVIKMNPFYLFFMANYTNGYEVSDYTGDGFEVLRGALSGAASGNLSGPLPWGQESMILAIFLLFNNSIKNRKLLFVTFTLAAVNVFLSGKRSCLTPLIIAIVAFLFIRRDLFTIKRILSLSGLLLGFFVIINMFPQLEEFNKNLSTAIFFWNDKLAEKEDIRGSSLEMRIEQFDYANSMISKNPLVGLGYGWASYYSEKHGEHAYLHGFESIYLRTVVESGILGLIIWSFFFFKFYKLTNWENTHKESLLFHLCFVMSCILTGVQASMWIYMLLGGTLILQKKIQ